jgi:tetratricopeptide (TPR) repeat protein
MSRTATARTARRSGRVSRWLGFALLSLLLPALLATDAHAASRSQRLKKARVQFEQAERLRADLDGTPTDKREAKEYLRAVYLYRRVYDLAPFHSLAATALANAAEIYHGMGKQFDAKYWHKAIETYEFVRKEYPHSRYQDDALFNIAQIYHVHLDQPEKARDIYQRFLRIYPRSRYAASARDRLKNIKAELAAARQPSPPVRTVSSKGTRGGIVEVRNVTPAWSWTLTARWSTRAPA